jgi:indolepyruvate ferredoxin oxidoreductase
VSAFDANRLSEKLMGDAVFANVMMLGFAWQKGLVPVGLESLRQAIELNGVAIEANHRAFLLGRVAAAHPERLRAMLEPEAPKARTLDEIVTRREAFLTDYQDEAWAARYRRTVDRVRAAEASIGSEKVAQAVARSLFKLMAYKDEYEVARLHTQTGFEKRLGDEFEERLSPRPPSRPAHAEYGTDARAGR